MEELLEDLTTQLRQNGREIQYNKSRLEDFGKMITENTFKITEIQDNVNQNTQRTIEMKERKLDAKEFRTKYK